MRFRLCEVSLKGRPQLRRTRVLDHAGYSFFNELLFTVVSVPKLNFEQLLQRFDVSKHVPNLSILVPWFAL
jgi:hypothetical protein